MEDKPKIIFSKTNRGKMQLIVDNNYKFNLQIFLKDGTTNYRCVYYKKIANVKHFLN